MTNEDTIDESAPDEFARGRPGPQSTLRDVRAQLVECAVETLENTGVDIALDHVKLADVISMTGVSRTTAYRSLADDHLSPQERLHRDVLEQILGRATGLGNLDAVSESLTDEYERQEPNLKSSDERRRDYAVQSLIRVGAAASYLNTVSSTQRAVLTASYGALRSSGADDWRRDVLAEGERGLTKAFGDLYLYLASVARRRLRPGLSAEQFSTAVGSLLEGLAMRHGISDHLDAPIIRPTGLNGEDEEWTMFAIGFHALYLAFFEPDLRDEAVDGGTHGR